MTKLISIIEIKAELILKTGLHIGAGDSEMHIGGIDNSVIKNPITQSPYIPGSSLKGKIRSLLEWRSGAVTDGKPLSLEHLNKASDKSAVENILKLFGISADSKKEEQMKQIGVARLGFWDCALNEKWKENILEDNHLLTEAKSENTINRITATASDPRQTERVPAGAIFDFKLTLRQFDTDNTEELQDLILKGLRLLELDSLGGSGSRGYGKIEFKNLTVNDNVFDLSQVKLFE